MSGNDHVTVAPRFEAELDELERRLSEQYPGVQAVMKTYALAQASVEEFDKYLQAVNPLPPVRTSNGSG